MWYNIALLSLEKYTIGLLGYILWKVCKTFTFDLMDKGHFPPKVK